MREGTGEGHQESHVSTFLQTSFFPVEFSQWGKSARKEARLGANLSRFPILWRPRYPPL